MSVSGMSGSAGSLPMRCTTSARKPSTPRSSQKRSTSCIASTTSGLSQLRSGCWGRKVCRYHCSVASSQVHAGPPPKAAGQLLGGRLRRAVVPAVPVALGRVARRAALDEPRVLVGGVVGHPVQQHADVARVRIGEQRVEGREVAEERVDVAVVGHVVAEVGHRRAVDRRQPERVDAEPLQVVQARAQPLEVADAVARRVGERARIDLVDDRLLPPHAAAKATGRRPTMAARVPPMADVAQIGVVGAGFMGSGIAESAARAGVAVKLYEPQAAALEHSRSSIEGSVARAVKRERLTARRGRGARSGASSGRPTSTPSPSPSSWSRRSSRTRRSRRRRSRTSTPRSAPRRSSRRTPRRSRSPGSRPPPGAPIASWGCTSSRRSPS